VKRAGSELRDEIARLLKATPSLRRLAERYERCHRDAIIFSCEQCGRVYAVPYSCNLVICEHCSKKRAKAIYWRYFRRIKGRQDLKHVNLNWGHELLSRSLLKSIYDGFIQVVKSFWKDFVAVLEISKTGHIHLHAIVVGMYVPQQVLSRTADERLGKPVVWISRAVPRKLGYLLKYIAKPPSFPSARDYVRYLRLMHRFRRVRSFGVFYGAKDDRPPLLLCRACGWYLQFDCVEEDGWWKEEHPPLYGYDPPVKVVMIRGGMV
jgi:hypothetical protein